MQRNLTWSLFSAALCLFALIYFVERKLPSSAERHEPRRVLPIASVQEIQAIEVEFPPAAVVRAEKRNGLWTLVEPKYPARQIALETFATNLLELQAFDRIPAHEVTLQG